MTIEKVKTELSASLNMLHGFCFNGKLCKGWRQVDETKIDFMYEGGSWVRVAVDEITEIGTYKIYDERNGFRLPYANAVTK